jgi:hypothetical protein
VLEVGRLVAKALQEVLRDFDLHAAGLELELLI